MPQDLAPRRAWRVAGTLGYSAPAVDAGGIVQNRNVHPKVPVRAARAVRGVYTRRLYSPVRVSISMRSPVLTNSGTGTSKPLATFAGFSTLPDVSPLTAGSV